MVHNLHCRFYSTLIAMLMWCSSGSCNDAVSLALLFTDWKVLLRLVVGKVSEISYRARNRFHQNLWWMNSELWSAVNTNSMAHTDTSALHNSVCLDCNFIRTTSTYMHTQMLVYVRNIWLFVCRGHHCRCADKCTSRRLYSTIPSITILFIIIVVRRGVHKMLPAYTNCSRHHTIYSACRARCNVFPFIFTKYPKTENYV